MSEDKQSRRNTSFVDKATSITKAFVERLKGSTFLTSPETLKNPFAKTWGVQAAMTTREAHSRKAPAKPEAWTVQSAKELLSSVLDGRLITATFDQIKSALSSKSVELETRMKNGQAVNYLRRKGAPGAIKAAPVSPELAYQKTLRKQLLEALNVSPDPNLNKHWIPGMAFKEGKWSAFSMHLGATASPSNPALNGLGYAVSNGKAYLGAIFADAHDKRPIQEILKEAKGVKLILPTQDGTINTPRIQGMPFLVAMRSLEAAKVHPGLSLDVLTTSWGSFADNESKKAARAAAVPGGADMEVDASSFVNRFVKKPVASPEVKEDLGNAFGAGFEAEDDIPTMEAEIEERRSLSFRVIGTRPTVYDHDLEELVPEMSLQDMVSDRYELANEHGEVIGYAVKDDVSLKFYEADGNPYRPKVAVARPANINKPKAPEEEPENIRAMRR